MRITPITYQKNTQKSEMISNNTVSKSYVSKDFAPVSNMSNIPYYKDFQPSFHGVKFERTVIKKVLGKKGIGADIYTPNGNFIDMKDKLNYENLTKIPFDITKATKDEITAYRFSLALIETYAKNPDSCPEFATHWATRFNPDNRNSPLAVSHSLNDLDKMEEIFKPCIQILRDPNRCKSLDIPITDTKGKLCLDMVPFDFETTGTDIKKDEILQIGAIVLERAKPVKTYTRFIKPEIPHIPDEATAVNKITDEMVADAKPVATVLNEFLGTVLNKDNGIPVTWNGVGFDAPLLNRFVREIRSANKVTEDKVMCEKQLCKVLDGQILLQRIHPYVGASKKLGNQYHWFFCKPMEDAHDATADCKGTVPLLKYCLYWLSEHRTNKNVPLTLRQVLLFQFGAHNISEIQPMLHPTKNFNKNVKFNVSYRPENLDLTNYFDKYHLDEEVVDSLVDDIGAANVQKMKESGIIGSEITEVYKNHPLNATETSKIPRTNKKVSLSYTMRENFKKVLGFAELEEFNGKTKEEIEDLIVEKSKVYLEGESKTLWLKNVNPDDLSIGNDLPDDNITRKVMLEEKESASSVPSELAESSVDSTKTNKTKKKPVKGSKKQVKTTKEASSIVKSKIAQKTKNTKRKKDK